MRLTTKRWFFRYAELMSVSSKKLIRAAPTDWLSAVADSIPDIAPTLPDRHPPNHRPRDSAREQAERLTEELRRGHNRGPLHGIPVGVKDIIDVFDLPTGCGSVLWANSIARQDAPVVKRLRQAGAVILGKTVTTPFAFL